jgi:intracellular sulfur oxidation DsrE/DsrF family protein
MFKGWKFVALMVAFMLPMALANAPALFAQNSAKVHKLVIQVSREDTEGMNLALGNAVNYKNYYDGKHEPFQIEIVAYGPGITIFRDDKSPVKDRIEEAKKAIPGLVLSMCGNAKAAAEKREGHEITPLAGVGVVPAGIVRVAELQEQGYAYARP